MKCTIPEISWHNKDPVLSIDIQPFSEGIYRLASGGTDSHILIWHLTEQTSGVPALECVSDLTRHQKAVNVVRFSPTGTFLASGDDESAIILWKQKTDQDPLEFPSEEENKNREQWIFVKVLRGHLEDIYDLSWSSDEQNLISGSVDNTAIIWDIKKGHMKSILRDHKSFVQGVAWDPAGQLLATLSSDRMCRFFSVSTQKVVGRVNKAVLPGSKPDSKPVHLFHDDTLKTFFRRLCFTPCGSLIIAPAGLIEPLEPGQKSVNATLIFTRNSISRPVAYLPSNNQYSVAVRCCPKLFALRDVKEQPLFNLPYRVVFAIATQTSVLLYDTQHYSPFAYIANIHYTRLTDLTWSSDGRILIVSSTDGYCSIITFSENELGELYIPCKENESKETAVGSNSSQRTVDLNGVCKLETGYNTMNVKKNKVAVGGLPKEIKIVQETSVKDETEDFHLIMEETVNDLESIKSSEPNDKLASQILNQSGRVLKTDNEEMEICENIEKDLKKSKTLLPTLPQESMEVNEAENIDTENNKAATNLNVTPSKSFSPTHSVAVKNTTPPVNITPIEQRKPKRAQLITLSSPKSKKRL